MSIINWPIAIKRNKYLTWYEKLVVKAQTRNTITGYTETHHIIPVSLGGDNSPENLVVLTAREHYIFHLLLWKMSMDRKSHNKMTMALHVMVNGSGCEKQDRSYLVPSRIYESNRKEYAKIISEMMSGENNPMYGKKHTEASLEKMKKWQNEPEVKERQRQRVLGEKNPMYGKNHSEEMKKQISQTSKERWTEDLRKEKSEATKKLWQNPEYREKMKESRQTSEKWLNRDWKTINRKAADTKKANGWKPSEESKRKLSETRKAKIASGEIVPWNKGKKVGNNRTPEAAREGALKAAASRKANGTQVSLKGSDNPFYGKTHTEETKAKIRATKLANKEKKKKEKYIKVVVHQMRLGDVEDPELYAAQPLYEFEKSERGQWIMANAVLESVVWKTLVDQDTYGYQVIVEAEFEGPALTEYFLKWT